MSFGEMIRRYLCLGKARHHLFEIHVSPSGESFLLLQISTARPICAYWTRSSVSSVIVMFDIWSHSFSPLHSLHILNLFMTHGKKASRIWLAFSFYAPHAMRTVSLLRSLHCGEGEHEHTIQDWKKVGHSEALWFRSHHQFHYFIALRTRPLLTVTNYHKRSGLQHVFILLQLWRP